MHHLQPPFEDTLEAGAVEAAGLVFGTKCLVVRVHALPCGITVEGAGDDEEAANAVVFESLTLSGKVGPSVCDHPTVFVVPLTLSAGALGYHPASQQWFVVKVDTVSPADPAADTADQRKCLQVWAARRLQALVELCGITA